MSKVYKKLYLLIPVMVLLALVLFPEAAWAADSENIFTVVKKKAASSLKEIKMVVYIIGGFGLIGFAFMAVFNKLSWKWFAHLAIGLFLVSAMGLFVDYFITQDGKKGTYSGMLDYGNYLRGSEYVPIEGGGSIETGGDGKTCEEDPTQSGCNKQQTGSESEFEKSCKELGGHYVNGVCLTEEEYQRRQSSGEPLADGSNEVSGGDTSVADYLASIGGLEEEEQSDGSSDEIIAQFNNSPEGCKNNGGHYILGKCVKASNIANLMDTIKKGANAVGANSIADLADKAKNNVGKADNALNKAEEAKDKYDKYKEAEAEKQAEQNNNSEAFAGLTDEEKAIFGQIEEEEADKSVDKIVNQYQKDECKKSGGYYVMGKCVTQDDAKEIANMAKEGAGVIKSDNLADGLKKAVDLFKSHKG